MTTIVDTGAVRRKARIETLMYGLRDEIDEGFDAQRGDILAALVARPGRYSVARWRLVLMLGAMLWIVGGLLKGLLLAACFGTLFLCYCAEVIRAAWEIPAEAGAARRRFHG